MFETIVVPLDGSALAEAALPIASELKERFGSKLLLLRVIDSEAHLLAQAPGIFESPGSAAASVNLVEEIVAAERKEATAYLQGIKQRLGGGESVETVLVEGSAGSAIVAQAQEAGADLIVMSSHGRTGLSRLVLGSVTDAVLKNSHIPVLLVRNPREHLKADAG